MITENLAREALEPFARNPMAGASDLPDNTPMAVETPGFVLVPREPTDEMLDAAVEKLADDIEGGMTDRQFIVAAYDRMLASAPLFPTPAYGGVRALEWDALNRAETEMGTYSIVLVRDEDCGPDQISVELDQPSFGISFVPTEDGATWEEASAAAQADFERRVLACLSPVAVEEADAKAGEPVDFAFEVLWHNDTWCLDFSEMPPIAPAGGEIRNVRPLYAAAPSTPSPQIGKAGDGPVGKVHPLGWKETIISEVWQRLEGPLGLQRNVERQIVADGVEIAWAILRRSGFTVAAPSPQIGKVGAGAVKCPQCDFGIGGHEPGCVSSESAGAGPVGEAVAWEFQLANARKSTGEYCEWSATRVSRSKPNVPESSIRNLRPLYASPVEESGEVERSEKDRNKLMDRIVSQRTEIAALEAEREAALLRAEDAEASLAETRERLEKQEEHTFRVVAENDKLRELADAAEELLEVSQLRGETDYLDPCADPGLWTSRRNEAWGALEEAIAARAALTSNAQETGK